MGTLLRIAGGAAFLATLFMPTARGCGRDLSQVDVAKNFYNNYGAAAAVVAAFIVAVLAILGPLLSKKPTRASEGGMMLLALAFAVAAVCYADAILEKGGSLQLFVLGQFAALAAIFVGALLRYPRSNGKT